MKDFILAALSFIIGGSLVLLAANRNKNSYLQEGMFIGETIGSF